MEDKLIKILKGHNIALQEVMEEYEKLGKIVREIIKSQKKLVDNQQDLYSKIIELTGIIMQRRQ